MADMKAAFEKIDREELWKCMEKLGIDERLRKRIEETYEDTTCRDRRKRGGYNEIGERVRQGCPLSPTLFNIDFADLEEEMRNTGRRISTR